MIGEYPRARLSLVPPPPVGESLRPAESDRVEKLWDALFTARTGKSARHLAELEDAVFRFYLPMARALARENVQEAVGLAAAEQSAELGLAQAVLAWRRRDSSEFRRFATSSIQLQLRRG